VIDSVFDPYAFVRNAWLQRREYQIRGEKVPEIKLPEEDGAPKSPDDDAGGRPVP
jgi:ABC-type transporter lipoprotein component MlaA